MNPKFDTAAPATSEQRRRTLSAAVVSEVARGRRVESQTEYNAMVVSGSKPNHMLHLILTLITCGAWSLAWIVVALVQTEHRTSLQVDEFGRILVQHLS